MCRQARSMSQSRQVSRERPVNTGFADALVFRSGVPSHSVPIVTRMRVLTLIDRLPARAVERERDACQGGPAAAPAGVDTAPASATFTGPGSLTPSLTNGGVCANDERPFKEGTYKFKSEGSEVDCLLAAVSV